MIHSGAGVDRSDVCEAGTCCMRRRCEMGELGAPVLWLGVLVGVCVLALVAGRLVALY